MKRIVITMTMVGLLASASGHAALHVVPGLAEAYRHEPYAFDKGEYLQSLSSAASANGYHLTVNVQSVNPGTSPSVTLGKYAGGLTNAGIFGVTTHGNSSGQHVEVYADSPGGQTARDNAFNQYRRTWGPNEIYTSYVIGVGYAIGIRMEGIQGRSALSNALVHDISCYGFSRITSWKAAAALGYSGVAPFDASRTGAELLYHNMNGENGEWKRSVDVAFEGTGMSLARQASVVLAPIITAYEPTEEWEIDAPTSGWVAFDCALNTANAARYIVYGYSAVSVSGQRWADSTKIEFTVSPSYDGDGTIVVSSSYASAPSGVRLDGDWVAPNGDDFGIPVCARVTQYGGWCNLATGFEGAWAWNEGGDVRVLFSTWPEIESDSMRVYGHEAEEGPGVPLTTVRAHRRPWSYDLLVPSGYHHYSVVEVINGREGDRGPMFGVAEGPPENLEALLAQNDAPWDRDQWNTDAPSMPARVQLENTGVQQLAPAHVLFYSSRQDFLDAFAGVQDTLRVRFGLTSNMKLGGNTSALECRRAAEEQWNANLLAGWDPPVLWVLGASYQDTLSPRNIVGMYQYPDTTGECYFGNCSSPSWWVNFQGRGKEMRLIQEVATDLAGINNAARIWRYRIKNSSTDPLAFYSQVGDLDNNVPTFAFHELVDAITRLYRDHGWETTQHWTSDFSPWDYTGLRDSATAVYASRRGSETFIMARNSNRSRWATVQKVNGPVWTGREVSVPQQNIAWGGSCDINDHDRINGEYWPTLGQIWTTANPDSYATMAAIVGYTRGGYSTVQDTIAYHLILKRFSGQASTPDDVQFQVERELWDAHPGLRSHFDRLYTVGGLVPLTGAPAMTAVGDRRPGTVRVSLSNPVPNPFRSSTALQFGLSQNAHVTVRVFDVAGRVVVNILADRDEARGYHVVAWNGQDRAGRNVPSGIYFMQLRAGTTVLTQRMLRLD